MKNSTLKCKCGEEKKLDYEISSMGDVIKEGWGVVPTFKGELIRMCPDCHKRLIELSDEIFHIAGSRYVSLSSLSK